MPKVIAVDVFDYGDMPKADIRKLEKNADRIAGHQDVVARTAVERAFMIGRELLDAREIFIGHHNNGNGKKHGDGRFGKWQESRCGFTVKTGQRSMQLVREFGDCDKLSQSFDVSALYLLSADSTLPSATKAALAEARKLPEGQRLTHKRAKEIVDASDGVDENPPFDLDVESSRVCAAVRSQVSKWPPRSKRYAKDVLNDLLVEDESQW